MSNIAKILKELILEKRYTRNKFQKSIVSKFNPKTVISKTKVDKI